MAELDPQAMPGLDALAGMAAAADADAAGVLNPAMAPGAPGAQADTGPDYGRSAAAMVDLASAALDGYCPGAGWHEQQREIMAASIAPVLEKYGFDFAGSAPCELIALFVCGPVLYQSAKLVAFKIAQDRAELARHMRGLADPNTIKGAVAAQSGPPTVPSTVGDTDAGAALVEAVKTAQIYPEM